MANQKGKKPKKKQRRSFLDRVDKIAVAALLGREDHSFIN